MLTFTTETGSTYQVDGDRVRRLEYVHGKRGDGEWLKLLNEPIVTVGSNVFFLLESLSDRGADDYGNSIEADMTTRMTSRVTDTKEE